MKQRHLGLKENWPLFTLLVLMSAFVGAMVGFERSLLPIITSSWGMAEAQSSLIMVATFGGSKAVANLFTGHLLTSISRKWTLVVGWCIAAAVPYLLLTMNAPWMAITANVALGISQGITWSATVMMKIDIAGKKLRGTAMGLNESAGYLAVGGASALAASFMDTKGDLRYILFATLIIVLLAIIIALFLLPNTQPWAELEARKEYENSTAVAKNIFVFASWENRSLRLLNIGGLVNNANDAIVWAVLPSLLLFHGESLTTVGILTGIHAGLWGVGQFFTGPLSNNGKIRNLLWWGLSIQGMALLFMSTATTLWLPYILLGLGTAMVYPTFLVGVSNLSHPSWRPKSLATYRFWRDMGYVIGALLGYLSLQLHAPSSAFIYIAILTLIASSMIRFSQLE